MAANAERNREYGARARAQAKDLAAQGVEPRRHGTYGYQHYGCRCEVCVKAVADANAATLARAQERSRAEAHSHRAAWTEAELELLARVDLGSSEIALKLGRTVVAVQAKRRQMRASAAD